MVSKKLPCHVYARTDIYRIADRAAAIFSATALLLIATAIFLPLHSARAETPSTSIKSAGTPNCPESNLLDLDFTSDFKIDPTDPQQDREKPLYFNIQRPTVSARSQKSFYYTVDKGTEFQTWLDPRVPSGNKGPTDRSLAIKITSAYDQNVKDKIFLSAVAHSGQNHMNILDSSDKRYISFDFMLDQNYELPLFWAIHLQAWQCCSGHPPFAMTVTPSKDKHGPVELNFVTNNDELQKQQHFEPFSIFKMNINRGEWHNIILALKPAALASKVPGEITMWYDGRQHFSWHGYWGFSPTQYSQYTKGSINENIGIDLGVYRRRQKTTQTILFDNIRLGKTLESVELAPTNCLR